MKKDDVKVSSGLGFDDLCKFIEKCVSKKYQVDKTESFRVSTLSLYTGSFIITIQGLLLSCYFLKSLGPFMKTKIFDGHYDRPCTYLIFMHNNHNFYLNRRPP